VQASREWFENTDQGEHRIQLLDVQIDWSRSATAMPNVTVTIVGRRA